MSFSAFVRINDLPLMSNELLRGGWKRKHAQAKKWKALVAIHFAKLRPPQPLLKANLNLTRASARQPDYDGLVSGFKSIIDGLVESEILANDTRDVIGVPQYDWLKAPQGKGHVLISVKDLGGIDF